ncbi:sensor histidine kinase KdpD [uncultured Massilia sp.]|uniref:sensor histidine kinase n=1 Tax=uncultured Massilia sp. TaxID=169973 RepID=UPI0025D47A6D|nr:HAMP domain-containing sensor histidine kinase [uncultured Massilia sp.]
MMVVLAAAAILRQAHGAAGRLPAILLAALAAAALGLRLAGAMPAPLAATVGLSAQLTALAFLAGAACLLCLGHAAFVAQGQWIALGMLLLALLVMAGYVFHDTLLYEVLPGRGTSIPTTLCIALVALGALALRPAQGIMSAVTGADPSIRAVRRLLAAVLAMPLLLGALAVLALRLDVADTGTVIACLIWGTIALFTAVSWHVALMLQRIEALRQSTLAALRAADANKDDFMALLAHELRNPLAPVRAAAELLRRGQCDPVQLRRTSDIIGRQVTHMTHLVDDLLDLARVRRGQLVLEMAPVDVLAVVRDALEQSAPQAAQRRQRLTADLPDGPAYVAGDHRRLVQVVANLLANAAKFTPAGGAIDVALRYAGDAVEIRVRDDGIGIGPELLPTVFDAFAQGARAPDRAEGGLGLGLALVRQLVERHGGRVDAHSAGHGKGSTFVVTLPRQA